GIAVSGQYSNIGYVTGASVSGKVVTDSDPSHYYGVATSEEVVVEPDEPEVEPEELIIPPEGPKVDPPLPRTDGFSITLFLIGALFLLSGLILKKSVAKNEHEHTF
ncbi:MAG: hypothetical protein MUP57_04810, partial [Clostridia bacterium]|nr:hypothetical protein [Clostridia bacterium]